MGKNKKKVIITMLIIVSMITIFFVFKTFINKEEKPDIKLKNINKSFAIMISEDGSNYDEYEGEEWPRGYTFKKAKCVDNNGNEVEEIVTYDEETNKITLKSKKTVYCTVYFDYKGTGEKELPYKIRYIEDLVKLSEEVNNGETYTGKYFELAKDLDFNKESDYQDYQSKDYGDINGNGTDDELKTELTTGSGWKPIGINSSSSFEGIFDGKDKTINNLYINNTTVGGIRLGLFGNIKNSQIFNVIVSGNLTTTINISQIVDIGMIVGNAYDSTIENCTSKGTITNGAGNWSTGGLVGAALGVVNIKRSHNEAIVTGGGWIGGLVGCFGNGTLTIEECDNIGIISKVDDVAISGIGGLVGAATSANTAYNIIIKNSQNKGEVKDRPVGARVSYVGGLIGRSYVNVTIEGSHNEAAVSVEGASATHSFVGGLIGADYNVNQTITITKSYNTGAISSNVTQHTYAGGIMGFSYGKLKIDQCHNEGSVVNNRTTYSTGYDLAVSGIVGVTYNNVVKEIKNSYNNGPVKGGNRVAGFIGLISGSSINIIDRCYNGAKGVISADRKSGNGAVNAGGFVGYAFSTVYILNSYNLGSINTTETYAGGLIGSIRVNGGIINSYNLGVINSPYVSSGIGIDDASNSNTKFYVNNVYNLGNFTGNGTKYGIGYFVNMTPTITNAYFKNDTIKTGSNVNNSNVIGKLEKDIKSQAFVNTLNINRFNILNLSNIDPVLKDYKLSGWVLGSGGYPVFAEEIEDLSGNGNVGININGKKTTEGIVTNDDTIQGFVNIGLDNYDFGNDLSFVVRVKFNKFNGTQEFMGNWDGAGGGFNFGATGILSFTLYGEDMPTPGYVGTNAPNSPAKLNTWYTLVGTTDNKKIRLYINGNEEASTNLTGGIKPTPAFIALGGNPQYTTQNVITSTYTTFSDVLIFDRALSAEEIKENYSEIPVPVDKSQLLLWYKF